MLRNLFHSRSLGENVTQVTSLFLAAQRGGDGNSMLEWVLAQWAPTEPPWWRK